METLYEQVEDKELIATRVPPGDNWELNNRELGIEAGTVYEGLVNTLSQYMRKTGFKGHYRLEPLEGKLYKITQQQVEVKKPQPQVYDIYGEGL